MYGLKEIKKMNKKVIVNNDAANIEAWMIKAVEATAAGEVAIACNIEAMLAAEYGPTACLGC